jgi:VWFA-related protein
VSLKPLEVLETSQVSSVLIDASVQDRNGRFVGQLQASDFRVRENGVDQALELTRQEEAPATFALLIDSSQSMSRRMDFVRRAATRMTRYLGPRDRMLVAPFSKQLQAITGPTNDRVTVEQAISSIAPQGGTAILDSLLELSGHLKAAKGRRAIVLITDGYDEHSDTRFDDALRAAKSVGATVYVVGIGGVAGISLKGERFMRRLASETGGRLFLPWGEEELATAQDVLAADVQNRYLLSYTSSNQETDGTWRAVTVETLDTNYVVRARTGYFAPRPAPVRPAIEFTISRPNGDLLDVSADDLTVLENGVEQKIETFQEAVSPVSIVLALDTSGSMKQAADAAKQAALRFVAALRPEDRLALILFSDTSHFAHDLSTERAWSLAAIEGYPVKGGTALYDALGDSLVRLKRETGRRVVVVVTDGRDENDAGNGPGSSRTFKDVLQSAKEVDAIVFGIGLGPKVDRELLETLAARSGGEAYFSSGVLALDEQYRRIVELLRRRWVLAYTSTNAARDGVWRTVEVRTRFQGAVVKSPGGYFSPAK